MTAPGIARLLRARGWSPLRFPDFAAVYFRLHSLPADGTASGKRHE